MWDPYTAAVSWRLLNMSESERRQADARIARAAPVVAAGLRTAARMVQLGEHRPARSCPDLSYSTIRGI